MAWWRPNRQLAPPPPPTPHPHPTGCCGGDRELAGWGFSVFLSGEDFVKEKPAVMKAERERGASLEVSGAAAFHFSCSSFHLPPEEEKE